MSPILEQGDYRGIIAQCDECGQKSGWLDDDGDTHTWTEERRTWRPADSYGKWLIVWLSPASELHADAPEKARVTCPAHEQEES